MTLPDENAQRRTRERSHVPPIHSSVVFLYRFSLFSPSCLIHLSWTPTWFLLYDDTQRNEGVFSSLVLTDACAGAAGYRLGFFDFRRMDFSGGKDPAGVLGKAAMTAKKLGWRRNSAGEKAPSSMAGHPANGSSREDDIVAAHGGGAHADMASLSAVGSLSTSLLWLGAALQRALFRPATLVQPAVSEDRDTSAETKLRSVVGEMLGELRGIGLHCLYDTGCCCSLPVSPRLCLHRCDNLPRCVCSYFPHSSIDVARIDEEAPASASPPTLWFLSCVCVHACALRVTPQDGHSNLDALALRYTSLR